MISAQDLLWSAQSSAIASEDCPFSQRFCIAEICVELRSDDQHLIRKMTDRFSEHVSHRDAQFTYVVAVRAGEYVFQCAHDGTWRWPHGPLPTGALAFLTDAAMMAAVVHADDSQLVSIHAAAFAHAGAAGAIAGDSTSGKTTTLLACARAGLPVYSDERALLRGGRVHPFLRLCNVRAGGRDRLLEDASDDRLACVLRQTQRFTLTQAFGADIVAQPSPLRALFVLSGYDREPAVKTIDAAQALPAISRWFDAPAGPLDRLGRAVALLRGIRCYRLTLGTPCASAQKIMEVMESTE